MHLPTQREKELKKLIQHLYRVHQRGEGEQHQRIPRADEQDEGGKAKKTPEGPHAVKVQFETQLS